MDLERTFESLDLEMLQNYRAQQQEENLQLEFKLIEVAALSRRDDRRNLAQALSGFSNSSGGLIIWGVDARKNADGVDCARDLREIDNVAKFIARLNELTGEAVNPIVERIQHRVIPTTGGKGFAVTLVPEADGVPRMAKLGEDRYYKRSGDSFYRMEHYDITDMFGRRHRPKLALQLRRFAGGGLELLVALRNDGRASARAPYLAFTCSHPFGRQVYGLDGNGRDGMTLLKSRGAQFRYYYGEGSAFTIHPGVEHQVTLLGVSGGTQLTENVVVQYAIACEDQPLQEATFRAAFNEIP